MSGASGNPVLADAIRLFSLAVNLSRQGQSQGAMSGCRAAIAAAPMLAPPWHLLSLLTTPQGREDDVDTAEAGHAIRRSLALDPSNAKACDQLGHILRGGRRPGRFEILQSLKAHRRATGLAPQDPALWLPIAAGFGDLTGQAEGMLARGECRQAALKIVALAPGRPDFWQILGNQTLEAGHVDAAMGLLRQGLSVHAGEGGLWHNLGRALSFAGYLGPAARACRNRLALDPGDLDATVTLALAWAQAGRFDPSARLLTMVTRRVPNFAPALAARANLSWLRGEGRERGAAENSGSTDMTGYEGAANAGHLAARRYVALRPDDPDGYMVLATVLEREGLPNLSIGLHRTALALTPGNAAILHSFSLPLRAQRRLRPARNVLRRLLSVDPTDALALLDLADVLASHPALIDLTPEELGFDGPEGQTPENQSGNTVFQGIGAPGLAFVPGNAGGSDDPARAQDLARGASTVSVGAARRRRLDLLVRRAERMAPDRPQVQERLSHVHYSVQNLNKSLKAIRQAASLAPGRAAPYNRLGILLGFLWRSREAGEALRRAVLLAPADGDAWNGVGNALLEQERFAGAEAAFRRALALDPSSATTRFNESFLCLRQGKLDRGFELYEAGVDGGIRRASRHFAMPRWRGEAIAGKRLLVAAEQGLGDEIRYAALYPALLERPVDSIFEVTPRLVSLFARSFPSATVRSSEAGADGRHPQDADRYILSGSLPHLLGPSGFPRPEGFEGYLTPDPGRLAECKARIRDLPQGLKVGVAWRTGRMVVQSFGDMATIDMFEAIFKMPGLVFVNLQYDDCREEIERAEARFGVRIHTWPGDDLKNDMELAAALTASLDVAVSVCISVNDIAGAVGTDCLLLWRGSYGPFGNLSHPFFPNHRIFPRPYDASIRVSIAKAAEWLAERARRV